MPKPPVRGGKKKNPGSPTAAAQRQAIGRRAGSPTAAGERERFKQFGDYLAAKDVSGRDRSAVAARRQGELKKYSAATGAAGVASGYGTVGAKKKSTKKVGSAAAEVRAAKNAKTIATAKRQAKLKATTGTTAEGTMDVGSRRWRRNPDGSRTNRLSNVDFNVPRVVDGKVYNTTKFGDPKTKAAAKRMGFNEGQYPWLYSHRLTNERNQASRRQRTIRR